jgi:hypothetical protein
MYHIERRNTYEPALQYDSIPKNSNPLYIPKTSSKRLFTIEEKSLKTPVAKINSNSLSKNSIYKGISNGRMRCGSPIKLIKRL